METRIDPEAMEEIDKLRRDLNYQRRELVARRLSVESAARQVVIAEQNFAEALRKHGWREDETGLHAPVVIHVKKEAG